MSPAALSRARSARYVAEVARLEKARCNIHCSRCRGRTPPLPDPGDYRARCVEARCTLEGISEPRVAPGNQKK